MVRDLLTKDLTNAEFGLFIQVCETTGLSPFGKQIYAIKRGGKMTIQTGIDGMRLIAQRSGEYAGQVGPLWCGQDGEWVDVWLKPEHPAAAKVGVLRAGFAEPLWATVLWKNAAQSFNGKLGDMWEKMGDHMLAKNAEAQALRKAFPQELSGLYADVEMPRAPRARRPIAVRVAAELAAENPVAEGVYEAVEEAMSAAPEGVPSEEPGVPETLAPTTKRVVLKVRRDCDRCKCLMLAGATVIVDVGTNPKTYWHEGACPPVPGATDPIEAEPVPDDEPPAAEPEHPGIGA